MTTLTRDDPTLSLFPLQETKCCPAGNTFLASSVEECLARMKAIERLRRLASEGDAFAAHCLAILEVTA